MVYLLFRQKHDEGLRVVSACSNQTHLHTLPLLIRGEFAQ